MTWISWMTWGWVNYQQKFFFFFLKWTTPLTNPLLKLDWTLDVWRSCDPCWLLVATSWHASCVFTMVFTLQDQEPGQHYISVTAEMSPLMWFDSRMCQQDGGRTHLKLVKRAIRLRRSPLGKLCALCKQLIIHTLLRTSVYEWVSECEPICKALWVI